MSQDEVVSIRLRRNTTSTPWGFRMQGGNEYGTVLFVQKVNPKSLSYRQGLRLNDRLVAIGALPTHGMSHEYAKMEIIRAGNELDLMVQRSAGQDQTDHRPVRRAPEQSQMSEESTEYRGYTNPNVQSRSFKILQESLSYSESNEAGTQGPSGHTPGEGVVQRAYTEGRRRLEELMEINPRNFTAEGESPYKYNSPRIQEDDQTRLNGVQPVAAKQYEGVHSAPREIPPPAPEPQQQVHHAQTKIPVNIAASSVLSPAGTQQEYLSQAHQYYQGQQPEKDLKLVNYQFDQQFGHVQQTPVQAQVRQPVQMQQQASDFIPATKTVSSVAEDLDLKHVKSDSATGHTQVLPVATISAAPAAPAPAAPQPQQAVTTQEQPRRRRQRVRPTRAEGQQPQTHTGQPTVVATATTDATDGVSASKPAVITVSQPPQAQQVVVQQAQPAQMQASTVSKPEPPVHSDAVPAAAPVADVSTKQPEETTPNKTEEPVKPQEKTVTEEPKPPVQEEPKPEAQPTEPEKLKQEAQSAEPEKPKPEAQSTEPEKPKQEAQSAEPEKPKQEAQSAEPEKPKPEAQQAEPEAPKQETQPAEPEKPKPEAQQAEPEAPKQETQPAEPEKPKPEVQSVEPEKPKEEAQPVEPEKPKPEAQHTEKEIPKPDAETTQKQEAQEVALEKETEQTKSDEAVTSESSVDTVVEVGKADTESTETIEIQHEQAESVVIDVSASHEESEVTLSVSNDAEAVISIDTSNETDTAAVLEISSTEQVDTQAHSEVDESVTFSVSEEVSIDTDHEVVIENVNISGESKTEEHDESATEVTFSMDVEEPVSEASTETKTETKKDEKKPETKKDEKKPEGKKDDNLSKPGKKVGKLNLEDRMPHSRSAPPKKFVDSRGGVSERLAKLQKK